MKNPTQGLTGRALGEAVLDHVLSFPEQHDQSSTAQDYDALGNPVYGFAAEVCGTTACIAGWTIALHYGVQGQSAIWAKSYDAGRESAVVAADLLGVPRVEFFDAVFQMDDRHKAISNLKHLLDTAS